MNKTIDIENVFDRLDAWRHLPAYQLERRADIFFSRYLIGVLSEITGDDLEEEIIPEFPIKRDLIWPGRRSNQSVKVDYVVTAKNRKTVYFVELKTDTVSRREQQDTYDTYLQRAKEIGLRAILERLKDILLRTSAHQKYHHLVAACESLSFWSVPENIESFLYQSTRKGRRAPSGHQTTRVQPRYQNCPHPTRIDGRRPHDPISNSFRST
jgi:hypothetical protein